MARQTNKLTDRGIAAIKEPGLHGDGGGLYLQVSKWETKSWLYRFSLNQRRRDMGIGPYPDVRLQEARRKVAEARALVREGIDPIEARKLRKARVAADQKKVVTFKEIAKQYIKLNEAAWKNAKHSAQWTATLDTYVYPTIGSLPVNLIETSHVQSILQPIWSSKTETAKRVRGRIEAILNSAKTQGLFEGENPARWKGHLENILPKPTKVSKVEHHAALSYDEVADFLGQLRQRDAVTALALEFTILTASRTNETVGALWSDIDRQKKIWTIAADRMKAGKEHRVPLSDRAAAILSELYDKRVSEVVFPNPRGGHLSNMAMLTLLKRMGRSDITVHGFRSTFRDWASETTAHPSDVVEMALAHSVGSKVEAAYRRGDLFEKRRRLMEDWAAFCEITGQREGNVAPLFAER